MAAAMPAAVREGVHAAAREGSVKVTRAGRARGAEPSSLSPPPSPPPSTTPTSRSNTADVEGCAPTGCVHTLCSSSSNDGATRDTVMRYGREREVTCPVGECAVGSHARSVCRDTNHVSADDGVESRSVRVGRGM